MTDEMHDTNENVTDQPQEEKSPLKGFIKHQRVAAEEAAKALKGFIPPEVRTHGRVAKEEFLMSFKVLVEGVSEVVDREINKMQSNKSSAGNTSSTTGKTKVKVEVS
jgi:hypothetical protein